MADLVQQTSDDQVALAICFGAVAFCGMIMYFSHHVGRLTGHIRLHGESPEVVPPAHSTQAASHVVAVAREKAA